MSLQSGVVIGSAETKEEVAEVLLVACRHRFTDPEIQQHLLEVLLDYLMWPGLSLNGSSKIVSH